MCCSILSAIKLIQLFIAKIILECFKKIILAPQLNMNNETLMRHV